MTTRSCAAILIVASIGVGCGGNPVRPEQGPINKTDVTSAAKLQIRDFTVTVTYDAQLGMYRYVPSLTLVETAGNSDAQIVDIGFQLLGIGANGAVPTLHDRFRVQAGGTVQLFEDPYWGPWLSIDNRLKASGVSIWVHYHDDALVGGVVGATVQVSE